MNLKRSQSITELVLSVMALTLLLIATGCEDPVYAPKPRAYPKVNYPEKSYEQFDKAYCDFTFQAPVHAKVIQDSFFFDEIPSHPCWFDIYYPNFDARIHMSYLPVGGEKTFDELRSDAFDLANWHNKKANFIEESMISTRHGVRGIFFEFEGPVASQCQFFLHDTLQEHFVRGALYFNTQARPDSLAPIYRFVRDDIDTLISTFKWE